MSPYQLKKPVTVRSFSVNYKHVFSLEFLYRRIHEWLIEEGYIDETSGPHSDKWVEQLYLERIAGNGAKQIWIWWRSDKTHNNPFFKFILNIDYHVLGLTEQEIISEGQKIKSNKGEVEVFITAKMVLDPNGDWDKNFFLKNSYIQNFYLNRIYKKQIENAEDELIRDCNRLLGAVKQYFQLESWLPEYTGKPYHPAKGE
jgi:hypothetical protein